MFSYNDSIHIWHSEELGIISRITAYKSFARRAPFIFQLLHQVRECLAFSSSCWEHIKVDSAAVYKLGIHLQLQQRLITETKTPNQ